MLRNVEIEAANYGIRRVQVLALSKWSMLTGAWSRTYLYLVGVILLSPVFLPRH